MFWDAVMGGLRMFMHWETYVAIVESLLISWGLPVALTLVAANTGRAAGAFGCFSMLLVPLLQTFAVSVFVITLSPIILGINDQAAWGFPWRLANADWWATFKFVGFILILIVVFAMVPIIGRMQSFSMLIAGALSLMVVLAIYNNMNDGIVDKKVHFWPGWIFGLGLLIVGAVLGWIAMICSAVVASAIESKWEGSGVTLVMPIGTVFGFLPVFIYGAWLALQLHA